MVPGRPDAENWRFPKGAKVALREQHIPDAPNANDASVLKRYPLLSRLSLMLSCLASLCAALFLSAGAAGRLEAAARAAPTSLAASRLAGIELMEIVLALAFLIGCAITLRIAHRALAQRTDCALARLAAHTGGADVPVGGTDEIDRLVRALDGVSAQLACRVADSERLSRNAHEQERFATRSLEFIYRACTCLAENNASTQWLSALLEDMADCLHARSCSLGLLTPLAESLGVPTRLGAPRLASLLDEFDAETLARKGGLRRQATHADGERVELAVPVRDADGIYGILVVEARSDMLFESRYSRLVDAVASLFALSLGSLQRTQRRRRLALMDERNAIAGELHDSLAQALSYMKLQIARLQLEIGRSCGACAPGGKVLEISGDIKTGLDSAYRHLRELLSAFRTSMPPGGLQQAIREVVEELSARAGTEIGLDYRLGDTPLSVNEEFHLLQIVREALTNVIRHARAGHALIRLDCEAGVVVVQVDDDGRGMAAGSGGEGHHGVSIMQDRARQLAGTLKLQPGPGGRGTRVELCFRPRAGPPPSSPPFDTDRDTAHAQPH